MKRHRSKRRVNIRHSYKARFIKFRNTKSCEQCNKQHLVGHVCRSCGFYKGIFYKDLIISGLSKKLEN